MSRVRGMAVSILATGIILPGVGLGTGAATSLEGPPGAIDVASVDAFLAGEMSSLAIPGLAVAIVENDHVVHARGFGVADLTGRPVTPETPFYLASVSKELTALAAMQLVEAGKLALDATVTSYIPWFATADAVASGQITVRELLNQTSGLSTLTGRLDEAADDRGSDALERAVHELRSASLASSPGAAFHYSNSNYLVLGLLVQTASGEAYDAYMREHVFAPLGMSHTHTGLDEASADGLATGYYPWFGLLPVASQFPFSDARAPAEGIMSSAGDMAHVVVMNLNDGRFDDRALISPAGLATLHTGVPDSGGTSRYGMGWFVHDLPGDTGTPARLVLDHDGASPNYHSVIMLLPSLHRGAVLLMNSFDLVSTSPWYRLELGTEQLLAGRPVSPGSYDGSPLTRYGRQLFLVLLVVEVAWIALWTLRRRREHMHHGRWRELTGHGATVIGLSVFVGAVAYIWVVLPGQFDITPYFILRLLPDVAVIGLALTAITVAWCAVWAFLASRWLAGRLRRGRRLGTRNDG